MFREYLVNFAYFTHLLEMYGFSLVTPEEARKLGMPNATGLFSELFTYMERQLAEKQIRAPDIGSALTMTSKEKRVSFYNRYFIFKKAETCRSKSNITSDAWQRSDNNGTETTRSKEEAQAR